MGPNAGTLDCMDCAIRVAAGLALALAAAGPGRAAAEAWHVGDLVFSDELGGFEILSAGGTGTPEDPIVVVERVTDDGPVVLVVRGLSPEIGNRARTNHFTGFVLEKVVINATGRSWTGYRVELEEERGRPQHLPRRPELCAGPSRRPTISVRPVRPNRPDR